jgi:hypothetical protein
MITVKKNEKKSNEYKVTANITLGKLLALQHALEDYAPASSVGYDLLCELMNGLYAAKINPEKDIP